MAQPSRPQKGSPWASRHRFAGPGPAALAVLAALFLGCSSKPPPMELDPSTQSAEGLQAVKNSRMREAWLDPSADFSGYHGMLIEPVLIEERPGGSKSLSLRSTATHFALNDGDRRALAEEFAAIFSLELEQGNRLVLVDAPGPGVLRLQAALVDVTKRVHTVDRPMRETVFANSTGQLTLVLEIRDSETDALLARTVDQREIRSPGVGVSGVAYSNPTTRTADLRRVFQRWAQLLHQRLEELQGPAPPDATEAPTE